MDDDTRAIEYSDSPGETKSWASRHPKLMILLIAAVFYVILFSMCGFVLLLVLRG